MTKVSIALIAAAALALAACERKEAKTAKPDETAPPQVKNAPYETKGSPDVKKQP